MEDGNHDEETKFSNIGRDEIVKEITDLASTVSSIIGYSTKNLLVEVSKVTRDQLANESIKPDFGSFRVHLFKYLLKYADLAEQKSRILSPVLIDLYRNEVRHAHFNRVQNILQIQDGLNRRERKKGETPTQNNNAEIPEAKCLTARISRSKDIANALKALLLVFSKFTSPKTIFREPELREIYLELLLSTDFEFQGGALSCLLTYKEPFLLPYAQHLHNLLAEKKLKDELVLFTVDVQNCVVDESHRDNLMPYVMRILYGKFYAKSVVRGKMKRLAIFRFFASCKPNELNIFIEVVFSSFFEEFGINSGNAFQSLKNVAEKYDPSCTIPLYKIRSALGIVNDMYVRLAPVLSDEQVQLLLTINLICAMLVNLGLECASRIGPQTVNLLKSLRVLNFRTFIQFFRSFQARRQDSDQIKCLFTLILEPMIRSYNDGLTKATPESPLIVQVSVVKLFTFWSKSARYFSLLNFQFSSGLQDESPLSLLCSTLLNAGTPKAVQSDTINAILSLLKAEKEDDESVSPELTFSSLPQKPLMDCGSAEGFGTHILLPQMKKILEFLSLKIPYSVTAKAKIPITYLEILNRISVYVEDERMGETFALTFLSYLGSKRMLKSKEKMAEIFGTMSFLSKHISDPIYALRRVTRLLSKLDERGTRDALLNFILALKTSRNFPAESSEHVSILVDLESYDRNRIEEADLERRFAAFGRLEELYEKKEAATISSEMIQVFAHSHAYCIISSSDIALRKTSSDALRRLIKYIARNSQPKEVEYILHGHLVPLVLDGLNSHNEICRTEFVYCLADLIARFPNDTHFEKLQPLNKFWKCSEEEEEEDDDLERNDDMAIDKVEDGEKQLNFFENAVHIQIHRRQRAFYRLTEQLINGELNLPCDLLLRYILPLFKPYLLETTSKLSALSDQSLRLFAVILEKSSWRKYHQTLELYLRQIDEAEKTKGIVRVLIAILGSFHFNVADVEMSTTKESKPATDKSTNKDTAAKNNKAQKVANLGIQGHTAAFGLEEEDLEDEMENMEDEKTEEDDDGDDAEDDDNLEEMDVDEDVPTATGKEAITDEMTEEHQMKAKQKILEYMVNKVLPRLRQSLHSSEQNHHKKSHSNDYAVDEELLTRAPIVLAIAKVLQKLPQWALKEYLNGLVAALNRLLLSRSTSVRLGARKIMGQFMQVLGAKHLSFVIKELRQTLLKGFQLYVMIFTVHTIIASLEQDMKPGDLDDCFEDVFEICKLELSSDLAEAKKNWSFNSVPEAKSNKSVETFVYLGKYISEKSMGVALSMVKETIDTKPKGGVVKKFSELLRGFSTGLHSNSGIDLQILVAFILKVLKEYLAEMLKQQQNARSAEVLELERKKNGYRPENCLLLPPEPKRIGELVKHSLKSKVSIFVEFSLQLLADVLKARPVIKETSNAMSSENGAREAVVEFDERDRNFVELLNKFVAPLIDCLKLKFTKVVALALRCLTILLRYTLANVRSEVQTIMERLFVILSEYVGMGQAGNNPVITELNQLLFKCFTLLIRDFPILTITSRRIEILLNYAETDLLDSHKQATSFSLIKAIVGRKIEDEKVNNIIKYLSELAITSSAAHTRTQCRQVILLYLTSHPSGKKSVEHWLEFFANQTEYEFESGRLSALEMLHSIFEFCAEEEISRLSLFMFMKLASRLVNDESEECRKFVSLTLRKLLSLIDESSFNDVYSVTKDWLDAKKDTVHLLALKTFGDFVHVQKLCTNKNLSNIDVKLYDIAEVLAGKLANDEITVFEEWSESVIVANFEYLNSFVDCYPSKFAEILDNIGDKFARLSDVLNDALRCISSPSIQLSASALLGRLLILSSSCASQTPSSRKNISNFDVIKSMEKFFPRGLKGVCFALCAQFRHIDFRAVALAEQAVKNIAITMTRLNAEDFNHVCTKLAGICWREIVREINSVIKRQSIFKLAAASVMSANGEKLESLCLKFLPLIYREMNRKSEKHKDEMCQMANEVADVFRSKLGEKNFSARLIKCQKDASAKFEERRMKAKALAVLDPAAEAIRKQKRHERKRTSKKRKLDEMRPHRVTKRRRQSQALDA